MSEIRCGCGDGKCLTHIQMWKNEFWFHTKDGKEHLMYLSANTIIEMIHALQECLREMAGME